MAESPAERPANTTDARPWSELRDSGLLWLINAAVLHPRGFALALVADVDGNFLGWDLLGDGSEPWEYDRQMDERFAAVEATFAAARPREPGS